MQSKNSFVAGLFVMALCGFVVAAGDVYKVVDFRLHSQQATMELADPDKKVVMYEDVLNTRTLDVRYVSSEADVIVPQKVVSTEIMNRLVAGEKISITYMTNNHKRVFYNRQRPQMPWGWLIVGVISLATAIFALKLYKREAA